MKVVQSIRAGLANLLKSGAWTVAIGAFLVGAARWDQQLTRLLEAIPTALAPLWTFFDVHALPFWLIVGVIGYLPFHYLLIIRPKKAGRPHNP